MGKLVALLGFTTLLVVISSSSSNQAHARTTAKKGRARPYVKCAGGHKEMKFFARTTEWERADVKCKMDGGRLATARTITDFNCLEYARKQYTYRGHYRSTPAYNGLVYDRESENFKWQSGPLEPREGVRWFIRPEDGTPLTGYTCGFMNVGEARGAYKLRYGQCSAMRTFFCERETEDDDRNMEPPLRQTLPVVHPKARTHHNRPRTHPPKPASTTTAPLTTAQAQPDEPEPTRRAPKPPAPKPTTQAPTTQAPTRQAPAKPAPKPDVHFSQAVAADEPEPQQRSHSRRVRRSTKKKRTLAIMGFGKWKPVKSLSIPYKSPVRPYVKYRATHCMADGDYPEWHFNYGSFPKKVANGPFLYKYTKKVDGQLLYVNAIRWPKECRAVAGLNGGFQCKSADGQMTRAVNIRVTGLPKGKGNLMPPGMKKPTYAPGAPTQPPANGGPGDAPPPQQTPPPVTTPPPTNATVPPTNATINATEPATIEVEAAEAEESSVNLAAIIVPLLLLSILFIALVIIRQRRQRVRKLKRSHMDRPDYMYHDHGVDDDHHDLDRTYSTATRNSYLAKSSYTSQQPLEALGDEDMSDTGFSLSQDSFDDCASYFNHHIYDPPGQCEEDLYGQLSSRMYTHIPFHNVEITEELGSGQFGTVSQGLWTQKGGKYVKEVAVKELRNGASNDNRVKLLQEAAIMGQFKHRNVVELFGVVTEGNTVMLVIELMSCDLRGYLRNLEHPPPDDIVMLFLEMSQDIAEGMAYLASCKFIHRDLAARNIMLDEDLNCKIGDFGMSRDLSDEDYYFSTGGEIPLKWTAPEAILYRQYSTMSDVWSYGILLAEIFTFGRKPYFNMTNAQVLSEIQNGYRMPQPDDCPTPVYDIMLKCWDEDRRKRPTFSQILHDLQEYSETLA